MSDVQADSWVDNPFTFGKQFPLPDIKPLPVDLRNPLKDCFTALKAKYIKMPPAKINPVEPVSTTQWTPEMGMGDTLADRFAPNPAFIGLPLKRKEVPTQRGTKGWNTHYNIMVDQSGSMQAESTKFDGVSMDRSMVCRLATACLIQQASLNIDSFTIYTYNDVGKLAWPLPEGEPSYDYQGALDYLTADSVNKFWNGYDKNQGEAGSSAYTRDHGLNYALNALAAMVPDGENNEDSAFEVMIRNCKKHAIPGMITVFITDGDNLAGPVKNGERSNDADGMTFDQWMRQFGHVFYIVLRSESEQGSIRNNRDKTIQGLMATYGWSRELASKFVWGFPDPKMIDPDTEERITEVQDQMGWLFAEIGRIFAGTSDEFEDLAEELGEIGPDGDYKNPLED